VRPDVPGLTSIKSPNVGNAHTLAASLMTIRFIILILLFANTSKAQCVDKSYVDNQIKELFPEAKVDSVRVYFINGKYFESYDTLKLSNQLNIISINEPMHLFYSPTKDCGYQPGYGTIYVSYGEFLLKFKKALVKRLRENRETKNKLKKKASS
jgi:uncharacterized protein (DUF2249 family)